MLFLQLKGTVYKPYDVNPQMAVFNVMPDAETYFHDACHHQ